MYPSFIFMKKHSLVQMFNFHPIPRLKEFKASPGWSRVAGPPWPRFFSHSNWVKFSIFSPSLANLSKQLVKRIVADSSSSCRYLGVRSQPACKGLRSLGQGAAPAGWWRQSLWCRERRMARGKLVGLKSSHWDVNWGWDVGGQLLVGQGEWLASGYNYILHKELLVELTQDSWVGSG